jgi:hypothetical protein
MNNKVRMLDYLPFLWDNFKWKKKAMNEKLKLEYVYLEADEGGYIGYFKDFPQHVTEGETIEELEEMLLDLYDCLHLSKYHIRELTIA